MSEQTLTLTLPSSIYRILKDRAEGSKRTVEDEIKEILVTAVPEATELPTDLQEAIASLTELSDDELWQAARTRLTVEDASELEALHDKERQREELTEREKERQRALMHQYDRTMLIRAQAAALLHQRGHDVSRLVVIS